MGRIGFDYSSAIGTTAGVLTIIPDFLQPLEHMVVLVIMTISDLQDHYQLN